MCDEPDPWASAREALRDLEARHLRRTLTPLASGPGPVVTAGTERLINFSSNNYLGLAEHPALAEAAAEAARRWGTGATASRLIAGTSTLTEELEARLAALRGAEAALIFPSGYHANLGAVGALAGRGDLVLADRLCHASLIDAARLSGATLRTYRHADLAYLEAFLTRHQARAAARPSHRTLVLTDSVFSIDGDLADLAGLTALTARHGALLLVDDAHALGVFGATGAGAFEHLGLPPADHVIQTFTLSKALGSQGGAVAGPRTLIDLLINRARTFIYTTGLAPPAVAAALAALDVMAREPERRARLWAGRERLAEDLRRQGWDLGASASPIVPLRVGEAAASLALAAHLRAQGLLGVAIRPPTVPRGAACVRLSVMATHTPAHIDRLLAAAGSFRA